MNSWVNFPFSCNIMEISVSDLGVVVRTVRVTMEMPSQFGHK